MPVEDASILLTLRELERWRKREQRLEDPQEVEQAARQVAYYRRLVSKMKRKLSPTTVSSVFDAFFR